MKILIVLAFAALVSGAPRPQDEDDTRIVMGERSVNMIPYQCTLNQELNDEEIIFSCGCSILDKDTVVIAAHCLTHGLAQNAYTIGVGSTDYDEQTWYPTKSYVNHPLYNTTIKANYDVAVIKLAKSIKMVPGKVEAIGFPIDCTNLPYGEYALASGFGNTVENGTNEDMLLKQVELKVLRNAEPGCSRYRLSPTMFCAGSDQATGDTCQGDSGGPLAYSNPDNNDLPELIGIVSTGAGCNRVGFAGIYTNVCFVKDWIIEKQNEPASPKVQKKKQGARSNPRRAQRLPTF